MTHLQLRPARILQILGACAALWLGTSAHALSTWGNLPGSCGGSDGTKISASGDCGGATGDANNLTIAGRSTAATNYGTGNFLSASVYNWGTSGLGVVNSYEDAGQQGPHAADSMWGVDGFLLSFNKEINLTKASIGWAGAGNNVYDPKTKAYVAGDSDISVFYWSGVGTPDVLGDTTGGSNALTSASNGWKLVGNYSNLGTNGYATISAKDASNNPIYSSYWLITAYDSAFGTAAFTSNTANPTATTITDTTVDAFKLMSVAGNTKPPGKAPEPNSLALVGLALAGFVAVRKRQKQSA